MKQKLYTKNEKGRYEEYQIPDMDISETLFRRINGKYVPVYVNCTNDLPEGVWVVTRGRSSREIISGRYLKEMMMLEKASDLKEMPSLAELGGWQGKLSNHQDGVLRPYPPACAEACRAFGECGQFQGLTQDKI